MTALELLMDLRRAGVVLSANGDRLAFDAPAGAMTPARREAIRLHKAELLALLVLPEELATLMARAGDDEDLLYQWHERAGIMEYDGGMDRAEAEWQALAVLLVEACWPA